MGWPDIAVKSATVRPAESTSHMRTPEPAVEEAAGGHVIGSVSVRHDPMDAIEETLFSEPIDEIILSVVSHGLATWLHQDLQHRLKHFGLPITVVAEDGAGVPPAHSQ